MNFHAAGRNSLFALLVFVFGAISVSAQVPTGSINGVVKDKQDLPISGAEITVTDLESGAKYTTKTASNGGYQITQLNFGTYKVEANAQGFKTGVVTDLKLDAATALSVPPITLEVGVVTETVTVEAGAETLQTTSAEVNDTVTKDQIEKLPILDRNPMNLLGTVPGVNQNGRTNTVINGQRTSFSTVTLDGINIQDNFIRANDLDFIPNLPFESQTAEFTVNSQNGNPAVEGSSQVSIVTPRGTNTWHGEGFWYYRSNKWAANDWFNNANGNPLPALNQNQGGGNVGGPIFKNKLFAYGYYEFLHLGQTTRQSTTILMAGARTGMFTYIPPSSTTPVTVNILALENQSGFTNSQRTTVAPVFQIDPAIASLLARVPTTANDPNVGDNLNTNGFDFNARSDNQLKNTGFRLDFEPSSRNSFSGTYAWNRQTVDRPDIDTSFNVVPLVSNFDTTNFLAAAWRWNPTNSLTNEVRFGFDLAPATFNTGQKFGTQIISGTIFTNPDPNFLFQGRQTHTWSWQDNAGWIHGNHALSFGTQIQRVTVRSEGDAGPVNLALGFSSANPYGILPQDFTNAGFPVPASSDQDTANALLSTLAGFVSSETGTFNVTSRTSGFVNGAPNIRNLSFNDWALYAGDSWHLRKNLNVNYGLRWEYVSPYNERDGLVLTPVIPAGQTVEQTLLSNATLNFAGGSTGRPIYNKDFDNFGPNVGIAWDPWGSGKTVFRAGYSVHFVNDETIRAADNAVSGNAGLSSSVTDQTVSSTVSGQLTANGITPLPAITTPTFQVPITFAQNEAILGGPANNAGFAINPDIQTPYVQDWNVSVQHNLGRDTTVTASYLGNHGTRLYRGIDINQVLLLPNGFLADFNRARSNAFLAQAAGKGFNPSFDNTVPGSQPLTVFPNVGKGGDFGSSTVIADIRQGAAGTLADFYHTQLLEGSVQFVPNDFIRGGDLLTNFSNSTFNAGLVEIRRRIRNGLSVQASYVYSKTLTDSSGRGQTKFDPLLDNANPRAERGRADFDITHAFKANFIYDLPFGNGHRMSPSNGFVNRLVGGWTISSIFTWQSGSPFSILSARGTVNRSGRSVNETADTGLSISQLRGDLGLSFPTSSVGKVLFINPSLIGANGRGAPNDALTCTPIAPNGFCNPAPGTVGTLERNAFNGPSFFNEDLAVFKQIRITERTKLELRGEAFNVLNHPTFFVDNQNINSTQFGVSNSTVSTPRILQIGASFIF
ncbi:MAG TPA: TonB-dependent receptor [Candidatus Acidoferrales bacterium]|nr:TonB-dependent receptor [Candidatus Acidoferrales bacterium]